MPAAQESQIGVGRIYGVAGTTVWTVNASGLPAGSGLNVTSVAITDSFKTDEIGSANGAVVETLIGSQRRRELTIELIPSSDTSAPTRAQAYAMVTHFLANAQPYCKIVMSGFTMAELNGEWNYMGGAEITIKRDTYGVASVKLAQFATAADGNVFDALDPVN